MRKRILLVDDDHAVQRLVTMTLGTTDFEVLVAGDGTMALDLAASQLPDLILLDVMMPDMDGFEVAAALRARIETANVPIVMLTARGSLDDLAQSQALGVKEHFIKPFSPLHLLKTVYAILENPPTRPAAEFAG
ncbi:MAG TPA: response regulator [Chloroflexota bacterium]|nr:response regulator [Chloroflexota bacterium]